MFVAYTSGNVQVDNSGLSVTNVFPKSLHYGVSSHLWPINGYCHLVGSLASCSHKGLSHSLDVEGLPHTSPGGGHQSDTRPGEGE